MRIDAGVQLEGLRKTSELVHLFEVNLASPAGAPGTRKARGKREEIVVERGKNNNQ